MNRSPVCQKKNPPSRADAISPSAMKRSGQIIDKPAIHATIHGICNAGVAGINQKPPASRERPIRKPERALRLFCRLCRAAKKQAQLKVQLARRKRGWPSVSPKDSRHPQMADKVKEGMLFMGQR